MSYHWTSNSRKQFSSIFWNFITRITFPPIYSILLLISFHHFPEAPLMIIFPCIVIAIKLTKVLHGQQNIWQSNDILISKVGRKYIVCSNSCLNSIIMLVIFLLYSFSLFPKGGKYPNIPTGYFIQLNLWDSMW